MSIENKINKMYGNMNNLEILNNYNCRVLLDISEPLMFVLNELNKYYFAYTLQNRTALLNNGTKADITELLIVNTSVSEIKMLIEGQLDIKAALSSDDMYRVGKIGNKVFPKKYVNSIEEVENRIPEYGVRFDCTLPNKINLKKILHMIESEAKVYDSFAINEGRVYIDDIQIDDIQIETPKRKREYNYLKVNYLKKIYGDRIEENNEIHY